MKDVITGPLFKWFGSKWSVSKHYPAPKFDEIVEPFAGGAGYSLRYHTKRVTLAESNQHVYQLWRWLIDDATEAAIREIPTNIPEGTDIRDLGLDRGQSLLLKNWQRTNNVGNCWTVSPWGNKSGQWTENTRARVASEFHLVKHWHVVQDAFSLMSSQAEDRTDRTWFVDPPYMFNYQYRSRPVDYEKLSQIVLDLPGQVVACEAICHKTGQVPSWLPFREFRCVVTSRRKSTNNHHSRELIYQR